MCVFVVNCDEYYLFVEVCDEYDLFVAICDEDNLFVAIYYLFINIVLNWTYLVILHDLVS